MKTHQFVTSIDLVRLCTFIMNVTKCKKKKTFNSARMWAGSRSQWPRGLWHVSAAACLLGLRVRIPPGHSCLSIMRVACCQMEVSASDWSLVQKSPAKCRVSESDSEASTMRMSWPNMGSCAMKIKCEPWLFTCCTVWATGWTSEEFRLGARFFPSPNRPHWFWGSPSLILNG